MPTTVHTHRTTYERLDGDRVVESAEVEIRFTFLPGSEPYYHPEHGGAPATALEVELDRVDVLCAPGTRIMTRRLAPAHIWSWAETYFLDHATDLVAEAAEELNCRRIERDEHFVEWERPLSHQHHNPSLFVGA